jgi:hypothetical protein
MPYHAALINAPAESVSERNHQVLNAHWGTQTLDGQSTEAVEDSGDEGTKGDDENVGRSLNEGNDDEVEEEGEESDDGTEDGNEEGEEEDAGIGNNGNYPVGSDIARTSLRNSKFDLSDTVLAAGS